MWLGPDKQTPRSDSHPERGGMPDGIPSTMLDGVWLEVQCNTVNAMAVACWFRAVFKDMSLMAFTPGAMHLDPGREQAFVDLRPNGALDGFVITWPSGATVEFRFGTIERQIATCAMESAGAFFIIQRA